MRSNDGPQHPFLSLSPASFDLGGNRHESVGNWKTGSRPKMELEDFPEEKWVAKV